MSIPRWKVGIDIGGTFTDIVATDGAGGFRHAKTLTTAKDPLGGLHAAIEAIGLGWKDVATLVHGTTLVTNSLVESKLARVALITTAGFEDVLAIARASRDRLYRLDTPPRVAPLVPRDRTLGIAERVGPKGEVLTGLSEAEIDRAVAWLGESDVEAVAICLLHAYANPAHEAALAAALRRICPFVSVSHEVSPEAREFERTTATVLNAAVMPKASAYLDRLLAAVPETTTIQLFHSAGGMAAPAVLRSLPLTLALSGPAAGASATADVCRALGIDHGLAFDMGGTTTDVCLVTNGSAEIASDRKLGGRPIRQPMVAIESVGAGGGSLVKLGPGGLAIGPESAGADPGPASYGLGGTRPTVTDINVALGYLDPAREMGGSIRVDPALAMDVLRPLATQFGRGVEETALGVLEVANAVMARALRRVTVQRGVDLRQGVLIAFGGAGPMHAVSLARQVGIARVLVPEFSSGFSAFGCVTAPALIARQKTVRLNSAAWDAERFAAERAGLVAEAQASLLRSGAKADAIRLSETALIRYVGQSVAVPVPFAASGDVADLAARFREEHRKLYGYATEEPFLVESLRVEATIPAGDLVAPPEAVATGELPRPRIVLPCCFDAAGFVATPRFDRVALAPSSILAGPCIIEDAWSTVVLPPGSTCRKDPAGHLHIEV
ncbi:MAG TPA: hydantoinase/oxoprolinase family protein [Stellaceae bacterium]|nr:hydantoinase/oxoprolinase family protein [Stellaceae bacterium]